jgi:two-component system chemotaxis response regulator CheY
LKRVLAVDDSPVTLSLIKDILTARDYLVETANGGQEALEKYAEFKPDVVTLDLAMPGLDGYQILRRLKDIDRYSKIIMVTASEHSSALQDCLEKGAVGYLSKPFKPKELVDIIEKASRNANNPDKNIVSLFSLVVDKIQNIMEVMFPSSRASVNLEDVKVFHNAIESSHTNSVSEYDSKSSNNLASKLLPEMILPSDDQVAFLTEIDGQEIGMVISFIRKSDLELLFDQNGGSAESVNNRAKEFFNILNTKVLSQLADATHLNLKTKPTMLMNRPSEKDQFWKSTSNLWDQIAMASFILNHQWHLIKIDVQLWYDGGRIFS